MIDSRSILHHLNQHRSIRKYLPMPVPEDVLERILTAATSASTSGNMQAYSIIVTSDRELKNKLDLPHFSQSMLHEAPLFLTFCADFHRMRRWMELRGAPMNFDNFMSFMIATIDAVLASQNAAIAAEAEGLGVCYMGTTLASCLEISEILNCPEGVVPVVGFSLGYPNEKPPARDRLPLASIVHRETYQHRTNDQILQTYQTKEVEGWKRYMNHDDLKKLIVEFEAENLAQVYTKVKYTRESHIRYSNDLLECLKQKGFLDDVIFARCSEAGS